jgi:hypothetical protein
LDTGGTGVSEKAQKCCCWAVAAAISRKYHLLFEAKAFGVGASYTFVARIFQ